MSPPRAQARSPFATARLGLWLADIFVILFLFGRLRQRDALELADHVVTVGAEAREKSVPLGAIEIRGRESLYFDGRAIHLEELVASAQRVREERQRTGDATGEVHLLGALKTDYLFSLEVRKRMQSAGFSVVELVPRAAEGGSKSRNRKEVSP